MEVEALDLACKQAVEEEGIDFALEQGQETEVFLAWEEWEHFGLSPVVVDLVPSQEQ